MDAFFFSFLTLYVLTGQQCLIIKAVADTVLSTLQTLSRFTPAEPLEVG